MNNFNRCSAEHSGVLIYKVTVICHVRKFAFCVAVLVGDQEEFSVLDLTCMRVCCFDKNTLDDKSSVLY